MKRKISANDNLISKFEDSTLTNLSTIFGGTEPVTNPTTTTLAYETHSSADDSDTGDHDSDA